MDDVKVFDSVLHHVAWWRGWVDLQMFHGVDTGKRKTRVVIIQKITAACKTGTR